MWPELEYTNKHWIYTYSPFPNDDGKAAVIEAFLTRVFRYLYEWTLPFHIIVEKVGIGCSYTTFLRLMGGIHFSCLLGCLTHV